MNKSFCRSTGTLFCRSTGTLTCLPAKDRNHCSTSKHTTHHHIPRLEETQRTGPLPRSKLARPTRSKNPLPRRTHLTCYKREHAPPIRLGPGRWAQQPQEILHPPIDRQRLFVPREDIQRQRVLLSLEGPCRRHGHLGRVLAPPPRRATAFPGREIPVPGTSSRPSRPLALAVAAAHAVVVHSQDSPERADTRRRPSWSTRRTRRTSQAEHRTRRILGVEHREADRKGARDEVDTTDNFSCTEQNLSG